VAEFWRQPITDAKPAFAELLLFANEWGRPWPEAKRLIREEKCPACMSDVSPAMARALLVPDVWTDPANPGAVLL
jgi:hypothetical protein